MENKNETQKAGCFLVNTKNKCIALVYRDYYNDYSFPKGHLEEGETLEECAIRETAEETKRVAIIVKNIWPVKEYYETPSGEKCVCTMFVATDAGHSDNDSLDTHPVVWVPFEDVEKKLSYDSLKSSWNEIKHKILELFN